MNVDALEMRVTEVEGLLSSRIEECHATSASLWEFDTLRDRVDIIEDFIFKLSEVVMNFNNGLYDTDKFLGDLSALFT